jgi:starch synthase
MRLLLASGEVHPYSKTGGLADMVAGLAKALARAGHRVGLVTPLYQGVREAFPDLLPVDLRLALPLGDRWVSASIWQRQVQRGLTIYFVDQPEFYQRAELYQENGVEYADNPARFAFLGKCIADLARRLPWRPELVHVHDWHVGLVPLLIRHQARNEGWLGAPRTCLTIHNLAYQGAYPRESYALTNLPWDYFHPDGVEFYGRMNFLKAGIAYADAITTVSPRYAREIATPALGCGLDGILRARQHVLTGILNGADYEEWRTTKNPHLDHPYTVTNLAGKAANKRALQEELGLPPRPDTPLFGIVSRLAHQKGVDILLPALEEMLATDLQCVLLGAGLPEFQDGFLQLAERHRGKVAVRIGYNLGLSHRIEAGCDFFLMPSHFEPCGLSQLYSLRYGTIPIVRATGGLDDSIIDAREDLARANGIKFHDYAAPALAKAIRKAQALFAETALLRHYRSNAMTADFGWAHTSEQYVAVYQRALAETAVG